MTSEPRERVRRVLVVEDDPDQREVFCALLYYNGFDVVPAASASEAVEAVAAQRPDVILLDVVLPDGNGLDAAAQLKTTPATADIPIICMTAHDIHTNRALAAGCSDLLRKPLNGSILLHAINHAIRGSNQILPE